MDLRRARLGDAGPFAQGMMTVAEEGFLNTEADATIESVEKAFAMSLDEPEQDYFVVEDECALVAALVGYPVDAGDIRGFGMWVDIARRRTGIGRRLVSAALAARKGRDFEIEVWPDNEAAIKLYEANEFEATGMLGEARERRDGSWSDVLLMSRRAGIKHRTLSRGKASPTVVPTPRESDC